MKNPNPPRFTGRGTICGTQMMEGGHAARSATTNRSPSVTRLCGCHLPVNGEELGNDSPAATGRPVHRMVNASVTTPR